MTGVQTCALPIYESLGWEVLVFAIKGIKESVAGFGKKKKVKVLLGFFFCMS